MKKQKKFNKIAGIHNGTTAYAKEMLKMGYRLVTVLSDFRIMNSFSQKVVNEMKEIDPSNPDQNSY